MTLRVTDEEAPHLLVAHTGDHRAAQAQACHAKRQIGRAATQVLGHAAGIFKAAAKLFGIQIHRQAAQAGQINRTACRKVQGAHDRNREYVEMWATAVATLTTGKIIESKNQKCK